MFVNSAVSQYPSLAFQFAFDQAGENFHTAAQCLVDEDSGQATPLLSKGFVESIGKIPMVKSEKTFSKPSGEFNVCMGGDDGRYGWLGLPRGTEPPAVIAISLRDLSSIKHAQQSLMTSGAGSSVIRQSKTILAACRIRR
jgi:hypothetical protein